MKSHVMVLAALAGMLGIGQTAMASDAGVSIVRRGTTDVLKARVTAGHWVTIELSGDGDTDLDLYVYDPYGHLVAYDDDPTDDCLVRFYALYTAKYTIKVVNRSDFLSNKYVIAID